MLAGILGFFISVFFISSLSYQWAWAIGFLCVIIIASSLISMTYGPIPDVLPEKQPAKQKPAKKPGKKPQTAGKKPAAKKTKPKKAPKKKTSSKK
mgnify:CR=1 FL=1